MHVIYVCRSNFKLKVHLHFISRLFCQWRGSGLLSPPPTVVAQTTELFLFFHSFKEENASSRQFMLIDLCSH